MDSKQGVFSISLDFELHWGIFDNVGIDAKRPYFDATIEVIPEIVQLFVANKIEATWATVGMLFNKDVSQLKQNYPASLPSYTNKNLSAYNFITTQLKDGDDCYYTAHDLVKLIDDADGQEVGTHTYSHFYALEKGQTIEQFEADIKQCSVLANEIGVTLKSIVFPRNQINQEYLPICEKYGVLSIRTNPKKWFDFNSGNQLFKKIVRSLDCYLPICNTLVSLEHLNSKESGLFFIQFSRLLKPVSGIPFANKFKIHRIKGEMTRAAKQGLSYHLWWHPHNFGENPNKAMIELQKIVKHYVHLKDTYGMQCFNMDNLRKKHQNAE